MVAIPFPLSSDPGEQPQEGGGRLINCFAEKMGEGARAPVRWRRSPGLRQMVAISGHSHARGFIATASATLVVLDDRVYAITESGGVFSASNLGALDGSTPVTIAANNAATPNIVAVTDDGAFNLYTSSAPDAFADSDLPVPNSVDMLDGYLIFTIGDGRIFATGLNAVTVSSLSYTTEQGVRLLRGKTFRGEFFAFGDKSIGVYRDAATSPFPLERRFTIAKGIVGTYALAGAVPGWADEVLWVAPDNRVYQMNGYTPAPVSTAAVERAIARTADRSAIVCHVYQCDGHAFWVMTSPGEWTWEYNLNTQNWNERRSHQSTFWRGTQSVYAFDRWVSGDYETGTIYQIDPTYRREGNDPLVFDATSGVIASFPARFGSPRADFDMTAAVGSAPGSGPIETDPSALISWSNDGGYQWSGPLSRKLGKQGAANQAVTVNRTGLARARGKRFRVQVSDPVHVTLLGGQLNAEGRAA